MASHDGGAKVCGSARGSGCGACFDVIRGYPLPTLSRLLKETAPAKPRDEPPGPPWNANLTLDLSRSFAILKRAPATVRLCVRVPPSGAAKRESPGTPAVDPL